jgi:hypothetical protein
MLCDCRQYSLCVAIYRRCKIKRRVYHSLLYVKRQSTISYFVEYVDDKQKKCYGSVKLFFTCRGRAFALINHHPSHRMFSDFFSSSRYHPVLSKCIDVYFHFLTTGSSFLDCISIDGIVNICIIFETADGLIVTPLSTGYEHD